MNEPSLKLTSLKKVTMENDSDSRPIPPIPTEIEVQEVKQTPKKTPKKSPIKTLRRSLRLKKPTTQ